MNPWAGISERLRRFAFELNLNYHQPELALTRSDVASGSELQKQGN